MWGDYLNNYIEYKFKTENTVFSFFTDRGSIVEVFDDLSVWAGIRKIIDGINANAESA